LCGALTAAAAATAAAEAATKAITTTTAGCQCVCQCASRCRPVAAPLRRQSKPQQQQQRHCSLPVCLHVGVRGSGSVCVCIHTTVGQQSVLTKSKMYKFSIEKNEYIYYLF